MNRMFYHSVCCEKKNHLVTGSTLVEISISLILFLKVLELTCTPAHGIRVDAWWWQLSLAFCLVHLTF